MTPSALNALRYVKNTNGCAIRAHFIEDHSPIGRVLWDELTAEKLVFEDENARIRVTEAGAVVLGAQA